MIRIGIGLFGIHNWFGGDFSGALEVVRIADRKGVDQVNVVDHVIMSENTDKYPYGKFPAPPAYPWYEPITVLAAIAGATQRIRLSTGVVISPLRPAVLLAKQLATLDVLSRGRVEIGLGVGWQKEEYDACGVPWEGRFGRMWEQVRVCKELWSKAPVSFEGRTVSFKQLYSTPFPVQAHMPMWFGVAPTERNLGRIAELGDGWLPMDRDPAKLKDPIARLRAAFKARGRDPMTATVRTALAPVFRADRTADLDATLARMPAMIDAGVNLIEFNPTMYCQGMNELEPFLDRIVALREKY
jgi:probable F420-dependent oxidoreductase